jgi:leader peptidase (prepilin peptidase)/N-methyltransferase
MLRAKGGDRRASPMPLLTIDEAWLPAVLIAPIIGSFLGVLIRRLPAGAPMAFARSRCESCGRALTPRELVPIWSYLWQRGRCRTCQEPIAPFHLTIELAAIAVAIWAALLGPDTPAELWADCLLGWTLLALAWIDWQHMRLPDVLTLPLLLAGLAATGLVEPDALTDHALGAALGWAGLRGLGAAYRGLRGYSGLGAGDAKLLAAGGAWLGWQALPIVLLLAALGGLSYAIVLRLRGDRLGWTSRLAFGPWLALGIWLVRLYGTDWLAA